MSFTIKYTGEFKKAYKRCMKRGYNMQLLIETLTILQRTGSLPKEYKPHKLSGNYAGKWECHIQPDWLLVWMQDNEELTLLMLHTGTHSDIFGK